MDIVRYSGKYAVLRPSVAFPPLYSASTISTGADSPHRKGPRRPKTTESHKSQKHTVATDP